MLLTFADIWNNSVKGVERKIEPRDHCWASELGKPIVDRYLAMKGVNPTNPPNIRSKRKFFAGDVWEFIAGLVLHQMGIVREGQEKVVVDDYDLRVTGKLDYKVGGVPDYNKARKVIRSYPFDEKIMGRFMRVIDLFEEKYGSSDIDEHIYEVKSCSEYVLEKIESGGSIPGHRLQIFHYLKGLSIPKGFVAYISKNDALMAEQVVTSTDRKLEATYKGDIKTLKGYLDANQRPDPAPLIVFDGKFSKNFGVEYSQYLNLVYGFNTPAEYSDYVSGKLQSWNRLLSRMKDIEEGRTTPTGKEIRLTDRNREAIEEIESEGYNIKDLLNDYKKSNAGYGE